MSPRLLVLTPSNSRSAAPVNVARQLATEMGRQGWSVRFRYLTTRDALDSEERSWHVSELKELRRGDVVHTHGLRPDLIVAVCRAVHILRPGVHWISTVHCDIPKDMVDLVGRCLGWLVTHFWRAALCRADQVVFLSHAAQASAHLRLARTAVISNGLPALTPKPFQHPPLSLMNWLGTRPPDATILATFATARPLKGIDLMLRAVAACPQFHFFHAGAGPSLPDLRKLARVLGIEQRCLFLGFVPHAMDLLQYSHVYLNCSSSEGSPLSVLEALRAGIPIVAPQNPPFNEYLNHPPIQLYKPNDIDSLVRAIKQSVHHKIAISQLERTIFDRNFTINAITQRYLILIAQNA